ncbi:hypothetical protein E1301_Tti006087 [Triplophysa tibetana]|uniref:Uncharacterized protein n=1 Tax=Triplophysa tibetana TaxID=1572043 RepID=A0A5A9PUM5_9TELE|nr:hypothetical protein E1301_Tti006087 [Triplophysa tibetana]
MSIFTSRDILTELMSFRHGTDCGRSESKGSVDKAMNAVKSTINSPDQNSRAGSDHDSIYMRKPDLHTSPHTERKSGPPSDGC